eukprot:CFRG1470T1
MAGSKSNTYVNSRPGYTEQSHGEGNANAISVVSDGITVAEHESFGLRAELARSCQRGREIFLTKARSENFGATLVLRRGHLFVVWIDKVKDSKGTKTVKDTKPVSYTPAYKAGLGFGDEIVSINGILVSTFGNNVNNVHTLLNCADEVVLQVCDKSVFSHHELKFHICGDSCKSSSSMVDKYGCSAENAKIGLAFLENGTISRVAEDGLGHSAGIIPGKKIVRIGDKYTLDEHPKDLLRILREYKKSSKSVNVTIVVGSARLIDILSSAAKAKMLQKQLRCSFCDVLQKDFDIEGLRKNGLTGAYIDYEPMSTVASCCESNGFLI